MDGCGYGAIPSQGVGCGHGIYPVVVDGCIGVHGFPLYMLDAIRFLRVYVSKKSEIGGNQTALLDRKSPSYSFNLGGRDFYDRTYRTLNLSRPGLIPFSSYDKKTMFVPVTLVHYKLSTHVFWENKHVAML